MTASQKVILITGANSGIGLRCAMYLSDKGHRVYGVGRNRDFKTAAFSYLPMDVSNEDDISAVVSGIMEKEKRIDLLLNNAGIHIAGAVEHIDQADVQRLFDTNFFGSLKMIRSVLPLMRKQQSGTIVCISSIGGITGLPFQGIYCASKFALEGMCETLRMELHGSGVHVVLVEPGDFRTAVTQHRKINVETAKDTFYNGAFEAILKKITEDETNGADPVRIAMLVEKIMQMKKPKLRYQAGSPVQTIVPLIKRILPASMFEKIIYKNYYAS